MKAWDEDEGPVIIMKIIFEKTISCTNLCTRIVKTVKMNDASPPQGLSGTRQGRTVFVIILIIFLSLIRRGGFLSGAAGHSQRGYRGISPCHCNNLPGCRVIQSGLYPMGGVGIRIYNFSGKKSGRVGEDFKKVR